MERVNVKGFGAGYVDNGVYTFDALPQAKFRQIGDAYAPIEDGFYQGQAVWCELHERKGSVVVIDADDSHPVKVDFGDFSATYTLDGRFLSKARMTLKPMQKFNVGQRVANGEGRIGTVISNSFKTTYPVMVQWDGDYLENYTDSFDCFTSDGSYYEDDRGTLKNIHHA